MYRTHGIRRGGECHGRAARENRLAKLLEWEAEAELVQAGD